ncbi:MAG: insulinase family protein, partial [Ignavibacteriae bacterium]|nr:insulinase family protein [Ignavibacteriota bacterium]
HTYYAPNNCVVVISGDVKFDDVKMFAEKYFGSIPSGPEPRKVHTIEPTQTGERRVFVQREVPTPYLMITYHVPQSGSEDYYALDLLNSILSQGRSSRLYSSLVEDSQLALEADSYYGDAFDPTLFYLLGVCNDGIKASELEKAMLNEIQKIIDEGINENELQKVKNQKLMEFYKTLETINGMSNTIGTYELFFGDYKKLFSAPDDYKKVTADDIKRVAAKYFTKENRTVGILNTEEE